ncbi:hypothetical protein BWR18_15415 [Tateyamaria omphalii]|uniref:Peptidase S8/S53 domain-containing protein n=1 Tax=Tateyamaria omphalii TaxID=299262 RepID=A0A1P8MXU9_9RHOB|nr:hypothetical protein BWR18_15415 [Tateyamaria omphalii]
MEGTISEDLGYEFEVLHDVLDLFRVNDIPVPDGLDWKKHKFPFVARVPEGTEERTSELLSRQAFSRGRIGAATPDYLVRPSASLNIEHQNISAATSSAKANAYRSECGENCIVGVIDSGVEPSFLQNPGSVLHRQLNARDPENPGTPYQDATGHGTLVAHIINQIAPSARILPVKAFDTDGALSDVLAALYIAHAAGPCDIINLSLSMSCDATFCDVCTAPQNASMNIRQLKFFFSNFLNLAGDVLLVAAAGNNQTRVASPAAFENVLAVGSYNFRSQNPLSNFSAVPVDRFILGPDGTRQMGEWLASVPGRRASKPLHGTSFATAFVTGVAAQIVSGLKRGPCLCEVGGPCLYAIRDNSSAKNTEIVFDTMRSAADTTWTGFDPQLHGLGKLRMI